MQRDHDMLIDVDIPTGIELDHDPDGLPKVVAKQPPKKETDVSDAIAQVRRERDEAVAAGEARAREAADSQSKLAEERKAREAAEGQAGENKDIASRAKWDELHAHRDHIASTIQNTEAMVESARRDLRSIELAKAKGDGDPNQLADAAVAVHERMAEAKAALIALRPGLSGTEDEIKRFRATLEAEAARIKEKPEPKVETKQEAKQEVKQPTPEDWIAGVRKEFGAAPADWVSEHREFVDDPKMNKKLIAFANSYVAIEEKPLNSKEFIEALNAKFFPEETEVDDEDGGEPEPVARKQTPSAPVTRNNGISSSGIGVKTGMVKGKVPMSPDERDTATQMYPNLPKEEAWKRYANNKARAIADGKYQR